jgi:hypothetical protein
VLHAFFKQLTAGANIYAGRTLHLRADSLSLSNGQEVATWSNEGSAGGSFIRLGVGQGPTYNTNQVNSKPAVTFQDLQAMTSSLTVSQVFGADQEWAIVVAARAIGDQASSTPGPSFLRTPLPADYFSMMVSGHSIFPTVNGVNHNAGSYASNAAFVVGHSNKSSGSHHIFNSTASANVNLSTLASIGSSTFVMGFGGSSYFSFMGVLEIMAFNRFKSAAELAAIAASLRSKYAIS